MTTKVVTGAVRLSYVHLFEKYAPNAKSEPKFQAMLLIPKTDKTTIDALRKAEAEEIAAGIASKWGGKRPKDLKSVIHDGDEDAEDYPERAGHWYLNASSNNRPGVVDQNVQAILDSTEVYSGCYARVSLNANAYSHEQGGKGVGFYLNHVQKVRDGEPLGNVTRAEDDFDVVDESEYAGLV